MCGLAQFNTIGNPSSIKAVSEAVVPEELVFTLSFSEVVLATDGSTDLASLCAEVAAYCSLGQKSACSGSGS